MHRITKIQKKIYHPLKQSRVLTEQTVGESVETESETENSR